MKSTWTRISFAPTVIKEVSVAVVPVDSFTGELIQGVLKVRIDGQEARPVRNLSGLYVFLDLPDGPHTIRISRAERIGYFDAEAIFPDPADPGQKKLIVEMTRRPSALSTGSDETIAAGIVRLGDQPANRVRVTAAAPDNLFDPNVPSGRRSSRTLSDRRGAFGLRLHLPQPEDPQQPVVPVTFTLEDDLRQRQVTREVRPGHYHSFSQPIRLDGAIDLGLSDLRLEPFGV